MPLTLPFKSFKYHTIAFEEAAPVQNTWYEICRLTGGFKIKILLFRQENDEVDDKNIEIRIKIDDEIADTEVFVVPSASNRYLYFLADTNTFVSGLSTKAAPFGLMNVEQMAGATSYVMGELEGKDILVEMRITSALGTNQYINSYGNGCVLR